MQKKHLILFAVSIFVTSLLMCSNNNDVSTKEIHYFINRYTGEQCYFVSYNPLDSDDKLPVIYLLNGWGADPFAWGSGANLQKAADDLNVIIISLSAFANAYVDIEGDSSRQYMTYVLDIVGITDSIFSTIKNRNGRALCGISNGGTGSIYIASQHPEFFCSASSLSGSIYGMPFTPNYNNLKSVEIRIDVGTEDGILSKTQYLHKKLKENNVHHIYNEHSGGHNWNFWGKYYWEQFEFHVDNFVIEK